MEWYERIRDNGNRVSVFKEPDIGDQLTGIACLSKGREFRKLKLLKD